jgi:hypothetical protein
VRGWFSTTQVDQQHHGVQLQVADAAVCNICLKGVPPTSFSASARGTTTNGVTAVEEGLLAWIPPAGGNVVQVTDESMFLVMHCRGLFLNRKNFGTATVKLVQEGLLEHVTVRA